MNEFETRHFTVAFNEDSGFSCTFSEDGEFEVDFGANVAGEYQGSYEVAPTGEYQTLHTTNKVLTQEIIIDPVPSNYGLIGWDGSTLTVS